MNALLKVFVAVVVVASALYWGVDRFLGTTEDLSESLDLKSLAYIRPDPNTSKPESSTTEPAAVSVEPVPEAPEREIGERIDATTVLPAEDSEEPAADDGEDQDKGDVDEGGVEGGDDDTGDEADDDGNQDPDNVADESDAANANAAEVSDEESAVTDAQQAMLDKLGIRKAPPPVRAVDVRLEISAECDGSGVAQAPVSVQYRFESPAIRGVSMNELELLVSEYRRCGGEFHFNTNPLAKADTTPLLEQMRMDELKYYFIQRSVPKSALRFPDNQ